MRKGGDVPAPLFTIDPTTGETTLTNPDGSVTDSTAADAFGQNVTVSNGQIRDAVTGQIVGNLGQQGPATVVPLEGGGLSIGSNVLSASANGPLTGTFLGSTVDVQRMVGGEFGVVDALGNEHTIQVGNTGAGDFGAYLAPFGKQRIAYDRADGTTEYQAVAGPLRSTSDVQSIPGLEAWRLATVRESTNVALRYWLVSHGRDVLKQIADAGGISGTAGTDNISGLVNYLAQMPTLDQLTFTNNYFLPAAEGA